MTKREKLYDWMTWLVVMNGQTPPMACPLPDFAEVRGNCLYLGGRLFLSKLDRGPRYSLEVVSSPRPILDIVREKADAFAGDDIARLTGRKR